MLLAAAAKHDAPSWSILAVLPLASGAVTAGLFLRSGTFYGSGSELVASGRSRATRRSTVGAATVLALLLLRSQGLAASIALALAAGMLLGLGLALLVNLSIPARRATVRGRFEDRSEAKGSPSVFYRGRHH